MNPTEVNEMLNIVNDVGTSDKENEKSATSGHKVLFYLDSVSLSLNPLLILLY